MPSPSTLPFRITDQQGVLAAPTAPDPALTLVWEGWRFGPGGPPPPRSLPCPALMFQKQGGRHSYGFRARNFWVAGNRVLNQHSHQQTHFPPSCVDRDSQPDPNHISRPSEPQRARQPPDVAHGHVPNAHCVASCRQASERHARQLSRTLHPRPPGLATQGPQSARVGTAIKHVCPRQHRRLYSRQPTGSRATHPPWAALPSPARDTPGAFLQRNIPFVPHGRSPAEELWGAS